MKMFKPDINPVSRLIVENKTSIFNQTESNFDTLSSNATPVYEKLYLSRNNSSDLLAQRSLGSELDSKYSSTCQFRTYKSPLPKIIEKRKELPAGKRSRKSKLRKRLEQSTTPRTVKDRNRKLYEMNQKKQDSMKSKRAKYLRKQQQEDLRECTFKPRVNPATSASHYTYQVSTEEGNIELEADFIKRNQVWEETRQERMTLLKKKKDDKFAEECTFTPRMTKDQSRSRSRSPLTSYDTTPKSLNYTAFDTFVNRQELARCLKQEKEVYKNKSSTKVSYAQKSLKSIDKLKHFFFNYSRCWVLTPAS